MSMIDVHNAKQEIIQHCPWFRFRDDYQIKWHDTRRVPLAHRYTVEMAIEQLEPRSLILRHAKHPHLVRVIAASYI